MYQPKHARHRALAIAMMIAVVIASGAFSAAAARTAAPGAAQASPEATQGDRDEFEFDLAGQAVRITGPQPDPLGMVAYKMADLLEAWGADVEEITLTTTAGIQALAAGQADLAGQGADELILGAAEGLDVVGIGSLRGRMDYVMVTTDDIASVDDLEGKTIGMSSPNGFDALLSRLILRRNGVALDDVNFVQIGGSGDRAAALLGGRIDAATIFISHWFEIESKSEDFTDLVYMGEELPDFTKDVTTAMRPYVEDHPELALAQACANLEAIEWFHEDKQAWIDYTREHVEGVSEDVLSQLYDTLAEIDMYPKDPNEVLKVEGLQALADAMLENGDIREQVDAAELVDRSYLEEASAMGCGLPA